MLPAIPLIALGVAAAYGVKKFRQMQRSMDLNSKVFSWLKSIGVPDIQLKKEKIDANLCDKCARPVLIRAVQDGNFEIIPDLIALGIDVNVRDERGIPALACVGMADNLDLECKLKCVQALLNAGADPNAMDSNGKPVVHYIRDFSLLELFMQAGALSDGCNADGQTLLFDSGLPTACIDFLLSKGVNIKHVDNHGKTPVFYHHQCANLMALYRNSDNLNAVDSEGKTPLFYAESVEEVIILLCAGVDPDVRDNAGNVAPVVENPGIFEATMNGYEFHEITQEFIDDYKKALEATELKHVSAKMLFELVKRSNMTTAKILNHYKNIREYVEFSEGVTLLEVALTTSEPEYNLYFLKSATDEFLFESSRCDSRIGRICVAQRIAKIILSKDNVELFEYAKKRGIAQYINLACIGSECIENGWPNLFGYFLKQDKEEGCLSDELLEMYINLVIEHANDSAFVYRLVEFGLDINKPIHIRSSIQLAPLTKAIDFNRTAIACAIVEAGADIYPNQCSMMWHAVELSNFDVVRKIVEVHGNVDELSQDGRSLVEISIEKCDMDLLEFLIASGAKLDRPGYSVLVHAMSLRLPNAVIKHLIDVGADVRAISSKRHMTPLLFAKTMNDSELVTMLVESD